TGEDAPHLTGQLATARVELDGGLAPLESERHRRARIEDLLDHLELHEMVARADRAEPQPRRLPRGPGQLTAELGGSPVAIHVEATALLDPLEGLRFQAEPIDRELRTLGRRPDGLGRAEFVTPSR